MPYNSWDVNYILIGILYMFLSIKSNAVVFDVYTDTPQSGQTQVRIVPPRNQYLLLHFGHGLSGVSFPS